MKPKEKKKEVKNVANNVIEDIIGREKFVDRVVNLINFSESSKSWNFAIDGEWGSGKSFVLNMIDEKLNKNIVVIRYDAWKNDFYEDPLIAILYTILDSSKLNSVLDAVIDGIKSGIECFSSLLSFIPGYDDNKEKLGKACKSLFKKRQKSDKLKIDNNFYSYLDGLKLLKEEFKKITKDKKLVILVDELDRCAPDYALKVLNRLHHLFDLPNIIVLTAINKEVLEQTIDTLYGANGKEYLSKIFDLTLKLNNRGDKNSVEIATQNFLSKLFPTTSISDIQVKLYSSLIKSYVSNNSRKRMHVFEVIEFLYKNLREESKNFDFLMLTSYLWLANHKDNTHAFMSNSIAKNQLEYSTTWLIKDFRTPNSNFGGFLGKFLEENTNVQVTQVGVATYSKSKETEINSFISLINLFRYSNDKNSLKVINQMYGTGFTEEDFAEIPKIIELIQVVCEGEK